MSNIVSIDAGDNHAVVIADNGSVYTWGDDSEGQLGIEPDTSKRFSDYDGKTYAYAPIKVQRGEIMYIQQVITVTVSLVLAEATLLHLSMLM